MKMIKLLDLRSGDGETMSHRGERIQALVCKGLHIGEFILYCNFSYIPKNFTKTSSRPNWK